MVPNEHLQVKGSCNCPDANIVVARLWDIGGEAITGYVSTVLFVASKAVLLATSQFLGHVEQAMLALDQ